MDKKETKQKEVQIITARNIDERQRQLLNYLSKGYYIVSVVNTGDGWVEYVLIKEASNG